MSLLHSKVVMSRHFLHAADFLALTACIRSATSYQDITEVAKAFNLPLWLILQSPNTVAANMSSTWTQLLTPISVYPKKRPCIHSFQWMQRIEFAQIPEPHTLQEYLTFLPIYRRLRDTSSFVLSKLTLKPLGTIASIRFPNLLAAPSFVSAVNTRSSA